MCKKTVGVVVLAGLIALGIGYVIGSKKIGGLSLDDNNNNASHAQWQDKSIEELSASLSNIMLPEEEYNKLSQVILQSATALMMGQAQAAGIQVNEAAQAELKKTIDDKYSRKYFTDMNSSSMKELSKEDLVGILSFYGTPGGQKFLKLSPKIIETTMTTVQADLSQWLPKAVEGVVAKLKTGGAQPQGQVAPKADGQNPGKPADSKNGHKS